MSLRQEQEQERERERERIAVRRREKGEGRSRRWGRLEADTSPYGSHLPLLKSFDTHSDCAPQLTLAPMDTHSELCPPLTLDLTDAHSELCPPVADVIQANDVVSQKLGGGLASEYSYERCGREKRRRQRVSSDTGVRFASARY